MAKPSAQVLLMQARREIAQLQIDLQHMKGFTIQQCQDMAQLALHREFGFGPVYQERFEKAFRQAFFEYADLCVTDGQDDQDIVYTKACIDRALREACGDRLLPFEERYAPERMYFRDSREQWKEGGGC